MLTLLLGTDWTENRREIMEMIAEDVRSEQNGRILMVPELISHDTERRLCKIAGNSTSRFAEVLSFSRLAQRVSESVGHGMQACLDNGGRLVAMASAARQLHGKLKTYASVETRPEFLSGLIEAVDEFKRCCISSADLMLASKRSEGTLAQKLEELSLLLETYDAICAQGKRDPRDQMNWLLEQLEDSDFAQRHVFYIDGFPDFTRQHMAILEHLICYAPKVVISLNCDRIDSQNPAFEKAGITAAHIARYARDNGIEMQTVCVPGRNDDLDVVRKLLFQGSVTYAPQLESSLRVYSCKSVYEECVAAAVNILNCVHAGARYKDISLVYSDPNIYQSTLDMVFKRFAIPAYQSGTEDVLDKSVMITVLSAIDVAVGGFDQSDVVRYMKSLMSPLDILECDLLENYAVMWSINGKLWQEEWTNHPKGLVDKWSDHDYERLAQLNANRAKIVVPLMNLQHGFHNALNVRDQVRALYDFLEQIRFADRLSDLAVRLDESGDNRNAQIANQLWEILLTALEQLHDVLGDTSWDADTFTKLLRLLISQYDVGTIPPMLDAVTVGPVSAMRCQQTDHLIVVGAAEGSLPGYGGSRGVLTDQERAALRKLGVPLTGGAMEGVQSEFAEIYGVFCGAQQTVTISCPPGQPSSIYRRMSALAGREKTIDTFLGAASVNMEEAASLLVRCRDFSAAADLHLTSSYDLMLKRCSYTYGTIEADTIQQLYGDELMLSASQVDKQALCRFGYFMRYGLKAKERKPLSVDPAEFGTYVHAVLEQTVREVMEMGGFSEVSLEASLEISRKHAEAYATHHFNQLQSERMAYLFRRNGQELELVVRELWDELRNSEFVPVGFEVEFSDSGEVGAIRIPGHRIGAHLRGFVDRVDVWQDRGNSYFRVVDYKTGKKDFDYCDIYNGLGLQMLLYLFALEDDGKMILGDHPKAAGVQYFPARVEYIPVDGIQDENAIAEQRAKQWKRKGLLLQDMDVLRAMDPDPVSKRLCCTQKKDGTLSGDIADAAQFKLLRAYVFTLLGRIVDEIASGEVSPNPYTRGSSDNACRFCPYSPVCHPASVEGRRNFKTVTAQRFWEDVEKEVHSHG